MYYSVFMYALLESIVVFCICVVINTLFMTYVLLGLIMRFMVYIVYRLGEKLP